MKKTLAVFCLLFLSGCSMGLVSSTAFLQHCNTIDFLAAHRSLDAPEGRWDTCFDISEAELEKIIYDAYNECIDQEYPNWPDVMSYSDISAAENSIDLCARTIFFKRYKDRFSYDADPEHLDICKKRKEYIDILR